VNGTIHGHAFAISDVISTATMGDARHPGGAYIDLLSTPHACADATAGVNRANRQLVEIVIADDSTRLGTAPTALGSYTILATSGYSAQLYTQTNDTSCVDIPADDARGASGAVTLTSISGNAFTGHYDIVLDSGDHVTGYFDAEACAAFPSTAQTTCM
jgi:hypothetical protein